MAVGSAMAVGAAAAGAAVGSAAVGAAVGAVAAGAAVGAAAGAAPPQAARSMPNSITIATALRNLCIRIKCFSLYRKRVIPDEQHKRLFLWSALLSRVWNEENRVIAARIIAKIANG